MGNLYSYFPAVDDAAALARFAAGLQDDTDDAFGTLGLKGADPYSLLGEVEAHLTGRPSEDVEDAPRFGNLLSDPRDEGRWLITLTDELRDALARANPAHLTATAAAVLDADDGPQAWDEDLLADFLTRLAALAGHAAEQRQGLYCLISL